jgi:Domain of unknown function (DUF4190)
MTIEGQGGAVGAASGCPTCGAPVGPGADRCQGCGSPSPTSSLPLPLPPPPPSPSPSPSPPPPPQSFGPPPGASWPAATAYPPPHQPPYQPPYQAPYPPAYPAPYQGYYAPVPVGQRTNGMAIASMVLGIVWLWWIGSILALVFGYIALGQIKQRHESGRGMAIAGVVLGWVGIATGVLFGILIAFAAGHGNSTSFGP